MKRRVGSLVLGLCLLFVLCPGAFAAADVAYFPEFGAEIGGKMKADKAWPAPDSSLVPDQIYYGSGQDLEACLDMAQAYVDTLVETGNFQVIYPMTRVSGVPGGEIEQYSTSLRYTGSAAMRGTLKAMRAGNTWGDYGEYHVSVDVYHDTYSIKNPDRQNSVTVYWDAGLRPAGIDNGGSGSGTDKVAAGESLTVVLALGYNQMCVGE